MPAALKFPPPSVTGVGQPDPQAPNPNADYPPGFVPPAQLVNPPAGSLAAGTGTSPNIANPIDDPSKLPSVVTQAGASLPTDPNAKASFIAQSLFPNLSQTAALNRVGYQNGRLIYQADDGKTYYAEPSFSPIQAPGRTLMEWPNIAASGVGTAMTAIPSIASGALTPEVGGGVPGAMAGAAAGDIARQTLASLFTGETKLPLERAFQTGEQALLGGGGQFAGNVLGYGANLGINKILGSNPLRVAGYDIPTLGGPRLAQGEANQALAQGMGVTVTPGEAMNSRSLLFGQRQLGRQAEGATPLTDFYNLRNTQQLPDAFVNTVLNPISPVTAPGVGARNLQQGAQNVIQSAVTARTNAASPFYQAAAPDTLPLSDIQATIGQIDTALAANPARPVAAALQSFRNELVDANGNPIQNIGSLDSITKYWRDKVALADNPVAAAQENATPKEAASTIGSIVNDLRARMTVANPTFAQGVATHAAMSPAVDELTGGTVGLAAGDRAGGFQNVPGKLFNIANADPMSVTSARTAFQNAGQMDAWNAGVRSFLDNAFQNAATQAQGPAPNLMKVLSGRQLQNLKAALAPDQFQALQDFMSVADMVRRAPAEGSPTATDIGSRESLAGPGARVAATAVAGLNPFDLVKMASDKILDLSAGKNIEQLVNTITSPDSVQLLRQLKSLSPGSRQWISGLTNLGTQIATPQFQMLPDQPFGYLNMQTPQQLP